MNKFKFLIPLLIIAALIGVGVLLNRKSTLLSGTLEMTEHSVGAHAPGRVVEINIEEGQFIRRGDVIAKLDRYEKASRDYERAKELFEAGGITRQALEEAELSRNDQMAISPVDGVVLTKVREAGEVVSAGSALAVIGDRSELWIKIFVPQAFINQVKLNHEVRAKFDGLNRKFKGHVSYIAPRAEFTPRNVQTAEERITQVFAVKIILDEVEDYLRPGVTADIEGLI